MGQAPGGIRPLRGLSGPLTMADVIDLLRHRTLEHVDRSRVETAREPTPDLLASEAQQAARLPLDGLLRIPEVGFLGHLAVAIGRQAILVGYTGSCCLAR